MVFMSKTNARVAHRGATLLVVFGLAVLVASGPPSVTTAPSETESLPVDTRAIRALTGRLGFRFAIMHTDHFSIVSDSRASRIVRVREVIEPTFDRVRRFAAELGLSSDGPRHKMTVVLFDTWEGYQAYAREIGFVVTPAVPGVFDQRSNQCVMFNFGNSALVRQKQRELNEALEAVQASDGRSATDRMQMERRIETLQEQIAEYERLINATVVRHEIAHQVLANSGLQRRGPESRRWLQEGLAMQFESEGAINSYRLADLYSAEAVASPIDVRLLITDSKFLGPGASRSQLAYATAWGLVDFLVERDSRAFGAYLMSRGGRAARNGVAASDSETDAFEGAFGPLDDAFESRFREYIRGMAARRGE